MLLATFLGHTYSKTARAIRVFKKGDSDLVSFESSSYFYTACILLWNLFEENVLLIGAQHGFRRRRSTSALLELISRDSLCDLSKAFMWFRTFLFPNSKYMELLELFCIVLFTIWLLGSSLSS